MLKILYVLGILSSTFLIQVIITKLIKLYQNKIAIKTKSRFDDEILPLINRFFDIAIWLIGLIIILTNFGIGPKALAGTLGVGGLAVALSIRDNVKDIISGLSLMANRPFKVGDNIKLQTGEEVLVLSIGISDTRFLFKNPKKGILIVRNSELNKSKILNYTLAEKMIN